MYKTLFNFITNPYIPERKNPSIIDLIKLYGIFLLAYIPLILIISVGSKELGITRVNFSEKSTIFIVYGVFLAPVIEEFIFRSWFKWSRKNSIILIILFVALIVLSFIRTKTLIYVAVMFILGVIFFSISKSLKHEISELISTNIKYFYWGSSIVFGMIHASNFVGNIWCLIGFSFILGSPQIVAGLIFGYIRLNYGLRYSILIHVFNNSLLLFSLFHK
jgi:membrane protease YdiL (CAAX protease family)